MWIDSFLVAVISGLLSIGFGIMLSTRSLVRMLIGVEVMFNASLLFLVYVGTISPTIMSSTAVFVVSMAAAEVLVTVSIIILYYRRWATTNAPGGVEKQ